MDIFVNQGKILLYSVFSLFWEKIFWWVQRKKPEPHNLFSFLSIQLNTLKKKVFLLTFTSEFSIHRISPQKNTPLAFLPISIMGEVGFLGLVFLRSFVGFLGPCQVV